MQHSELNKRGTVICILDLRCTANIFHYDSSTTEKLSRQKIYGTIHILRMKKVGELVILVRNSADFFAFYLCIKIL